MVAQKLEHIALGGTVLAYECKKPIRLENSVVDWEDVNSPTKLTHFLRYAEGMISEEAEKIQSQVGEIIVLDIALH
jgi:hypothetical protein